MATELSMPQMGFDMQEGIVVRWLVSEGADVKAGDAIAEIETDKAVVEFESTAEGVLRSILVPEGTTVPVGQPIAIVGAEVEELGEAALVTEGEPAETPAPEASHEPATGIPLPPPAGWVETPPAPDEPPPAPPVAPAEPQPAPAQEVRASPVARRLAEERGIDLTLLQGTGPGDRITRDDVLNYTPPEPDPEAEPEAEAPEEAEAPPTAPVPTAAAPAAVAPAGEVVPLTRMRQQIARVTARSKDEIPHFYVSADVDMTGAMELRRQLNESAADDGARISVNDMVIKACVVALKRYPRFNASFTEGGIQMSDRINVGIAIAQEAGLALPAILDCGDKTLSQISAASKDLVARANSGALHPEEYSGGTFSISNMGMFNVTSFVAIIHPPNAAVLAVGRVVKKPVVKDDELEIAEMMTVTLSADHRVVDGAEGAQFVMEVKRLLENPLGLLV